jgi:DNA-binding CsgD family transcriptional regulator
MVAEIEDRWAEAETHLTGACERWRALGAQAEEAWALTLHCRVALGLGDGALAARNAEQALTLFRAVGHPSGIATALSRLAEIARGHGDDRRAAAAFHEALQIWSAIGERWLITLALAGLADLAAGHDQTETAAALVGCIDALAEANGAPLLSAARLSRDRAVHGASAHLGEARFGARYAAGLATRLEDAVTMATGVVVPDHDQPSLRGVPGLTAREREVLRLMARMHTDREIAEVLSLSRRTVSGHVTHILGKLDATTRREAVARGRALGLLPENGH